MINTWYALNGMLSAGQLKAEVAFADVAEQAYLYADAMLDERAP